MEQFNEAFRKRTNIKQPVSFDTLDEVLKKTAAAIPFENKSILKQQAPFINKEYLSEKLLRNNEGGLCYELNPLLYHFLKENGMSVQLIRGTVFDQAEDTWSKTGNTHVLILLSHKNEQYVVDTGFGNNLPLTPVPLTGEIVTSENGAFRINHHDSEYTLEMNKNNEWKVGYKFSSNDIISDDTELEEIRDIILKSPLSPFNKKLLITKCENGMTLTLTESSFIQNKQGEITKVSLANSEHIHLAKKYFNLDL
ncbi:arylamine N-acetyltransferase family protein [Cytobacillus horneckiae]|uniref:arylamine N-acetyltransferase family protein n=1 Tax=Cytobacillus horneckiae TaxID=549687 RepID=UPI003D20DCCE